MADKVHYFLMKYKGREWSGPAWYSYEKDESGFPEKVTLEYWHPLHLGSASSTDWDGKDLIKIYKKLQKEYPKIGKEWVQGNIHSHHGMGAFFSGTDNDQLIDGANPNIYGSLVVSTKPGKELAFALSYPDQFNNIHIIEVKDMEVEQVHIEDTEWSKQAKVIEKKAKKERKKSPYMSYRNKHQANLFLNPSKSEIDDLFSDVHEEISGDELDMMTYDEIQMDYARGRMTLEQANKKLKKEGLDGQYVISP
jgi:hypothetical protein